MPKENLINATYRLSSGQLAYIQIVADRKGFRKTETLRYLLDFAIKYHDRKEELETIDNRKNKKK